MSDDEKREHGNVVALAVVGGLGLVVVGLADRWGAP